MKISNPIHKSILHQLFFNIDVNKKTDDGRMIVTHKEFQFPDVVQATTAFQKLEGSLNEKKIFNSEDIEFTPQEIIILNKLFKAKKTWNVTVGLQIQELHDIFNGKKEVPSTDSKESK